MRPRTVLTFGAAAALAAGAGPPPPTRDCVAAACREIRILGAEPASVPGGGASPFRGAADPSLRHDPRGGPLWMAYSWPHVAPATASRGAVVPGVDILLASSADGGRTWRAAGSLWSAHADTDRGGSGEPGRTSYEVASLAAAPTASGAMWYGARIAYFLPEAGGFRRRPPESFRVLVSRAEAPAALRSAPTVTLGSARTAAGWGVDVDISALAPAVAGCDLWNEPALDVEGDHLYLALRCLRFHRGRPQIERSEIVVFATRPEGDVRGWRWRFVGVLAGADVARELGGVGVTQVDLVRGRDGRRLALLTPDAWDASRQDFVHLGCRVVEVESLDPPRLARDAGRLRVRASVTASDQQPLGPGACGYDPAAETGVILVRRAKKRGEMSASLHATGVHP